jgi:chloramphenicol 3-O-phosphotransferase
MGAAGRRAVLVLFSGPAGAGKSTLAAAWCAGRQRAVHIQLDSVREMIVAGRADPQVYSQLQAEQYSVSVSACLALASVFLDQDYDVAIDDAVDPPGFDRHWRPLLGGRSWRLIVVLPDLNENLARSAARAKRVKPEITRAQHAALQSWPERFRIDTTGLSVEESLALARSVIEGQEQHG